MFIMMSPVQMQGRSAGTASSDRRLGSPARIAGYYYLVGSCCLFWCLTLSKFFPTSIRRGRHFVICHHIHQTLLHPCAVHWRANHRAADTCMSLKLLYAGFLSKSIYWYCLEIWGFVGNVMCQIPSDNNECMHYLIYQVHNLSGYSVIVPQTVRCLYLQRRDNWTIDYVALRPSLAPFWFVWIISAYNDKIERTREQNGEFSATYRTVKATEIWVWSTT